MSSEIALGQREESDERELALGELAHRLWVIGTEHEFLLTTRKGGEPSCQVSNSQDRWRRPLAGVFGGRWKGVGAGTVTALENGEKLDAPTVFQVVVSPT